MVVISYTKSPDDSAIADTSHLFTLSSNRFIVRDSIRFNYLLILSIKNCSDGILYHLYHFCLLSELNYYDIYGNLTAVLSVDVVVLGIIETRGTSGLFNALINDDIGISGFPLIK